MSYADQARISEQHRLAQARLLAIITADVARFFPMLDVNNIDATFGPFFEAMLPVITARRTLSASLAATYYDQIRSDYDINQRFTPVMDSKPDYKKLFTSFLVTGPIGMKKNLANGLDAQRARDAALVNVAKAAQRHVADGGRGTIIRSVQRDPRGHGWARLTDGRPCAFCALLASRGPVYRSQTTAGFHSHDGCGCTAVPVFDTSAPWPGRAEEFRKQYDETIQGHYSGGDGNNKAVRAWRKHYDGLYPQSPEIEANRTAKSLVAKAKLAEPRLTKLMKDFADSYNGELAGLDFRLKTEESLQRKILADMESTGASASLIGQKMFDVNRYTMTFDETTYAKSAQTVVDKLRADGYSVKVKNYWNVADNPYQGINMQITGADGTQFELQFHTSKSLSVKEGALHKIYELSRVEKDPAKIAEYTEQSFQVASEIPVPAGVQTVS